MPEDVVKGLREIVEEATPVLEEAKTKEETVEKEWGIRDDPCFESRSL